MKAYQAIVIQLIFIGAILLGGQPVSAEAPHNTLLAAPPLTEEVKELLAKGIAAAKEQDWDIVIKHFNAARESAPTFPVILFNLALAYESAGGRELLAIVWYRAYLASDPDSSRAQQVRVHVVELEAEVEAKIRKLVSRGKGMTTRTVSTTALSGRDRDEAYSDLVWVQSSLNDFVEGKETAALIKTRDYKTTAYFLLASGMAKAGDISGAKEYAAQLEALTGTYPEQSAYIQRVIAEAQIKAGDLAGAKDSLKRAFDIASRISRTSTKLSEIWSIGLLMVKAGDIRGAKKIAAKLDSYGSEETLTGAAIYYAIVNLQAEKGNIAKARKAASRIKTSSPTKINNKDLAYYVIAKALLKADDISGAKKAAARVAELEVPNEYAMWGENIYGDIIVAQLKVGDIAGAQESKAMIRDTTMGKAIAYARIAGAEAEAGDMESYKASIILAEEAAKAIVSKYSPHYSKSHAYAYIARAQAQADDMPASKASIARAEEQAALSSAAMRPAAFKAIAETYTKQGNTAGAVRAGALKAQAKMDAEVDFWTQKTVYQFGFFKKPTITDLQSFLLSLDEKENPIEVLTGVADAALDMTHTLNMLRESEASYEKIRANEFGGNDT